MHSLQTGIITFFLSTPALAAGANSCESQFLDKTSPNSQCMNWQRDPKSVLETLNDGTILPNPARIRGERLPPDVAKHAQARTIPARLQNDFQRLKESMIQQVTGGSAESSWNDHQKFLVARLRQVELSLEQKCDPAVDAKYEHVSNKVSVCPLVTAMPFEAILPLLAHELGHLADPCNYVVSRRPTARSNPAAIRSCLSRAGVPETPESRRALSREVRVEWVADTKLRAHYAALESCGLVTPTEGSLPRTYQGSPYLPLITCVSEKNASTLRASNLRRKGTVTASTPLELHSETCDPHQHRHKECTADAVGTALTQFHLRRLPEQFPPERRKLLTYFFASVHCDAHDPKPTLQYATSERRFIDFLQIPEVQTGAQCRLEGAPDCRIPSQLASPPAGQGSDRPDSRQ